MKGHQSAAGGDSSNVIQSGRDTIVGLGVNEIKDIISSLAEVIPKYTLLASEIVDRRLDEFERKVLERFRLEGADARAFVDPDFQHAVSTAQRSFARLGHPDHLEMLTEILASRSMQETATRRALILNDAVQKAPLLTKDEIHILCAMFRFREIEPSHYVRIEDAMAALLEVASYLDDVADCKVSCEYIDSLHLTRTTRTQTEFINVLRSNFAGLITAGINTLDLQVLLDRHALDRYAPLFKTSPSFDDRYFLDAINQEDFFDKCNKLGIGNSRYTVWQEMQKYTIGDFSNLNALLQRYPELSKLADCWDKKLFGWLELGTTGLALGYISSSQRSAPRTSLYDWI